MHKWRQSVGNGIVFLVTAIVLSYFFYIGIKNVFRYNVFRIEYQNLLNTHSKERHDNQTYRHMITNMESDHFWDLEARLKLGFVKENEQIYRFY